MKKRYVSFLCAVFAIVWCFMGCTGETVPAAENGEEFQLIYENEIRPQMLLLSQDPAGDWENEPYEGSTLGQHAKEKTRLALEQYHREQAVFAQYGVCAFTYEGFLTQWQSQGSDGNPYGVQSYSKYDYYVYLHSVYRLQVIEQLDAPEDAVLAYYESNREHFMDAEVWELELWQTHAQLTDGKAVLEAVMNGESREEVSYTRVTIDADGAKYHQELLLLLEDALEQLKTPGQTVYRQTQKMCLLARCESYTPPQYKSYEECKSVAAKRYKQAQYEQLLSGK